MVINKERLISALWGVGFLVSLFIVLVAIHLGIPYWFPIDKEKAIADNIIELNLSPDDNAYQIAVKASNWVVNDTTNMWWSIDRNIKITDHLKFSRCLSGTQGLCFAKKDDKIKLVYFLRSSDPNKIYFFMKSKKGACAEGAVYLTKIMDYFGFKSRIVKKDKWDHIWVEFFDKNNTKYYADTYMGVITDDFNEFRTKINWVPWDDGNKFIAIDLNYKETDISEEYFILLRDEKQ